MGRGEAVKLLSVLKTDTCIRPVVNPSDAEAALTFDGSDDPPKNKDKLGK